MRHCNRQPRPVSSLIWGHLCVLTLMVRKGKLWKTWSLLGFHPFEAGNVMQSQFLFRRAVEGEQARARPTGRVNQLQLVRTNPRSQSCGFHHLLFLKQPSFLATAKPSEKWPLKQSQAESFWLWIAKGQPCLLLATRKTQTWSHSGSWTAVLHTPPGYGPE